MSKGFCTTMASIFPSAMWFKAAAWASNVMIVSRSRTPRSMATSAIAGAL